MCRGGEAMRFVLLSGLSDTCNFVYVRVRVGTA